MITPANAAFTCWLGSLTRSLTCDNMFVMMTDSRQSAGKYRLKSFILLAAAALTSASVSLSKLPKANTSSDFVISGPTASCSSTNLSATTYRTRHDLSSIACLSDASRSFSTSSCLNRDASVMHASTAKSLTESFKRQKSSKNAVVSFVISESDQSRYLFVLGKAVE